MPSDGPERTPSNTPPTVFIRVFCGCGWEYIISGKEAEKDGAEEVAHSAAVAHLTTTDFLNDPCPGVQVDVVRSTTVTA